MIEFSAKAKKGAIIRTLLYAVREKVERIAAMPALRPDTYVTATERARRAANLIALNAPNGSDVHVKIAIEDDALGGTHTLVMVDITPPPPGRKAVRQALNGKAAGSGAQ